LGFEAVTDQVRSRRELCYPLDTGGMCAVELYTRVRRVAPVEGDYRP